MNDTPSVPPRHPAIAWLRREALPLAVMLLLLGVARDTLANHYQVPSGSMQPTLQPGDRVAVDMRAYGVRLPFTQMQLLATGTPQRGDVAVFDSPADGTRLIKRVVAVGGDRVALRGGYLSINGRLLQQGVACELFDGKPVQLDLDAGGGPDIPGFTLPAGKLLVMGDHRGNSFDGRFFGLVDADKVYGKALAVYWRRGEGLEWQRL
ncbi:signal peptidase I [Stenotrophomonas pictorum JCM 9942]|uniref:Signal peptidase I n=1 Tax=Stenotrophomonas pictorum JCM 9942 TaxID=1236960 RepID=A0A0R0AIZ5_9GAMM|nr:signal peptidase I [Stenotrophomonas pictorum]KRG45152.1 signal peptidase I [Stenotrophomonas pictorum JCM 9942]